MSLVRIEMLAARLGVSVPTVRLWVKQEIIPFYRGNRVLLFDLQEVLASLRHDGGARIGQGSAVEIGRMS
jgi:DNA-binding transcriptional MerR regulator